MDAHQKYKTTNDRRISEEKQSEHERDYTDAEKHYVRKHVWEPAASDRLIKINATESRQLKYFTLCAEKAIDVYYFYFKNLIGDYDGLGYPTVAYCECDTGHYETLAANLGRTLGFHAYFEDLVLDQENPKSKEFYSSLPFDIYNLDFTGVCFPRGEPPFSRTLDAIVTLINKLGQPGYRSGFDIFFTFRAQRSEENRDAIRDLKNNLDDNIRSYPWYNDLFIFRHQSVEELLQSRYHEFLLCSLPKLIGGLSRVAGFQVSCPFSLYYPRPNSQNPKYYIVSFVLKFDWVGVDAPRFGRRVRQQIPLQDIVTDAYLQMIRAIIERNIQNVGSIKFPRQIYIDEVNQILNAVNNP